MQLNNFHSTPGAATHSLERKPMEKSQHMNLVARGALVHTVAQEDYKLLSIVAFCNFFLLSCFFFVLFLKSWKYCEVQQNIVTSETGRFQFLVQFAPSSGYVDQQGFFKSTGNMAYLKFAYLFGHKILSLFHHSMNQ